MLAALAIFPLTYLAVAAGRLAWLSAGPPVGSAPRSRADGGGSSRSARPCVTSATLAAGLATLLAGRALGLVER